MRHGTETRRAEIVFFDGGGGHRSAAVALKEVLETERGWDVRLLNLPELLDDVDVIRRLSGVRMQDVYNAMLKRGWTLGASLLIPVAQHIIRRVSRRALPILESHWRGGNPDIVISVVPNVNRPLRESLARARPSVPFVTVLTDLADYPPHFWVEPEPQYFICGTAEAIQQVISQGHVADSVFLTSGMILHPKFYVPMNAELASARRRMGLSSDRPTGLVLFGAEGSSEIANIATRLVRSDIDLQLILVCGRNARLADRLRRTGWQKPVHIEGFTRDVASLMDLSDFMIGKPGPGSISEAMARGLPVIVDSNAWTLPQERFNVEWIRMKEVGLVVKDFDDIVQAVRTLLDPEWMPRYRANVAALHNRAVFEVPAILDTILARHRPVQ